MSHLETNKSFKFSSKRKRKVWNVRHKHTRTKNEKFSTKTGEKERIEKSQTPSSRNIFEQTFIIKEMRELAKIEKKILNLFLSFFPCEIFSQTFVLLPHNKSDQSSYYTLSPFPCAHKHLYLYSHQHYTHALIYTL